MSLSEDMQRDITRIAPKGAERAMVSLWQVLVPFENMGSSRGPQLTWICLQ